MCSCSRGREDLKDIPSEEQIDDGYIEIVPLNAEKYIELLADDEVILSEGEIFSYNQKIMTKTNSLYDINNMENLSIDDIRNYITKYQIPNLPQYDTEREVTNDDIVRIKKNCNLDNITGNIRKGIIIKRTNLKSFPTTMHFYNVLGSDNFDNLQETEVHVNTGALILHESLDKVWKFVIVPNYAGWVLSSDIAYASDEEYDYFVNSNSFGIITDALIEIDDTFLDMSVKLPYLKASEDGYHFDLPIKDENGNVMRKEIVITRDKAHIGYLPYTKRNVYIEAFKYEGMNYSWGGMDRGVDCSSFVSNVYRTFGFNFPRNTSDQKEVLENITYMNNMSNEEKLETINNEDFPSLLYQPGHVMIYLGKIDGVNYIIHSSGSEMKVTESVLDNSSYLNKIDRVISAK